MARQIGSWIGKARQLTRSMQRQLEDELDAEKNLGINPDDLDPSKMLTPRDDDTYSPVHDEDGKPRRDDDVDDEDTRDNSDEAFVKDTDGVAETVSKKASG